MEILIKKITDLDKSKNEEFINEYKNSEILEFYTSGTTASPKKVVFTKKQLQLSAQKTIDLLQIKEKSNLLLCLNPNFIASKMQIVRAIEADANLIISSTSVPDILEINERVNFASYVPIQLNKIFKEPKGKDFLNNHTSILVGGATIDDALMQQINALKIPVYQTFGMTETATHIATRLLNGAYKSEYYLTLPKTEIDYCSNNCLKIKSDVTNNQWIETTDVVKIIDKNKFYWLGRNDFVINSGGIKIYCESLENTINSIFKKNNIFTSFILSSIPDQLLGEMLVLVLEKKDYLDDNILLLKLLKNELNKYECPKKIIYIDLFPINENGKVMRNKIKEMIL